MPSEYTRLCAMALRPAFFACVALLIVLSWLPGDEMVRTGISARGEHTVAYFGTAIIMALAYRERPRLYVQTALLVMLAGVLEIGQLYVPGRTSAILDFMASGTGAAVGGLVMALMRPRVLIWLGLDRLPDGHRS
jgi:hypothetical protein